MAERRKNYMMSVAVKSLSDSTKTEFINPTTIFESCLTYSAPACRILAV